MNKQHLDSLDVRDNSLWRTIRALTRKRSLIPALQGRLGTAYSEEEKAEAFGDSLKEQFSLNIDPEDDPAWHKEVGRCRRDVDDASLERKTVSGQQRPRRFGTS